MGQVCTAQQQRLSELLATGRLNGDGKGMRMHLPQLSVNAAWGGVVEPDKLQTPRSPLVSEIDSFLRRVEDFDGREHIVEPQTDYHSLIRVYTFIFAMRIYIQQLGLYHQATVKFRQQTLGQPRRRLQVHLFQLLLQNAWKKALYTLRRTVSIPRAGRQESTTILPDTRGELSFKAAMALLENRDHAPDLPSLWQRYKTLEEAARSPISLFALKTAAGAMVFAILLFADSTRQFFLEYSLQSGLLTLLVAIAPTLGQTLFTFGLQLAGSGLGYLWGAALLSIFRGVGGYAFNPYGIVAFLLASSLPLMYLIYYNPRFFVFAVLALNGTGVLVINEWVYVEYWKRPFDSPIYRAGKLIATLGIAISLAITLQIFVFRNPARRTFRKAMAKLTFSVLSYYTLFHAWGKVVIPDHDGDQNFRPPTAAVVRVNEELYTRELEIQQSIIDMLPLLAFAGAERDFGSPFRANLARNMLKSVQIMLDRMKEARYIIDTSKLPDVILRELSYRLAPYRKRHSQMIQASLHSCAASLASKAPLPAKTATGIYLKRSVDENLHDALLISSHLSRTPEGKECVLNGELTRFFAFAMTLTSLPDQLLALEDACRDLFGDIDSKLT